MTTCRFSQTQRERWGSVDGSHYYWGDLAWRRHGRECEHGKYHVVFTAGIEAAEFIDIPLTAAAGVPAVVDDFGDLVRVPHTTRLVTGVAA